MTNNTVISPVYPMLIQKYNTLIPDPNANVLDKINTIIDYLNQTGKLTNDVVNQWNQVMAWAMNDGLTTDVSNKLETMLSTGEFDTLFQKYIAPSLGDIKTLQTNDKTSVVNAINEVDQLAKTNQTNLGTLANLVTADKSSLVNAVNEVDNLGKNNQTNIGTLSNLQTIHKTDLVSAVNDNVASLAAIATIPQRANGETDDAPSINRAIANGATVILLPTSVQLNSPINATNRADKPLKFIGQGWSEYGGAGTTVNANTGGVAFDCTGSQYVSFEDMRIYSDNTMSNPSTIGILAARGSSSGYAQFHNYQRISIYLVSKPSVNSGRGSICIFNMGAEHFNVNHAQLISDTPLVIMATNILNISSPFTSFGSIASASLMNFKQVAMLSTAGPSMELWDCYNIEFDKCYWARTPANNTIQAIVIWSGCSDIFIKGQIEQYQRAMQLNGEITNLEIKFLIDSNATTSYIYLNGSINLYNPKLMIDQHGGTSQQFFTGTGSPIFYGGEIVVQYGQGLNTSILKLIGTNINLSGQNANAVVVTSDSIYSINGSKISKISDGSAGYIQYINGHTEQWMNVVVNAGANTDQTFNFPIPFTNSCDNVQLTPIGASSVTATENGRSTTGVTIRCSSASPTNVYVRVIGH